MFATREHFHSEGRAEYVYFPVDAVFSLLTQMRDGTVVEVGTVGYEGIVGVEALLGDDLSQQAAACLIPGSALKIERSKFLDLITTHPTLRTLCERYLESLVTILKRAAACNCLHSLWQRSARWLLAAHDRAGQDTFPLTHDYLATMLGVRRAGVSIAAAQLAQAGCIAYKRGRVTIVDRNKLAEFACECYEAMSHEFVRLSSPLAAGFDTASNTV